MSKLMFALALTCSAVMYNPQGLRDFTVQHATDLTWQLKAALYSIERMTPSFIRFGRS